MSADVVTTSLDGVTFRLRAPHDFSFLRELGRVFRVFDEQDSGNICFGLDTGTEKLFVKYAGASTILGNSVPAEAIRSLQGAMPPYGDLRHPLLVDLRGHFAAGAGYAAIFTWSEGECLHVSRAFTSQGRDDSALLRHRRLPLAERLDTLEAIFAFHEHVVARGYVAIDFYDGSIIYDFARRTTTICDIDCYRPRPYVNEMGRLWGSTRFMSPEEFERGAAIDEVTNVFNLGATAFVLLGGERDRSLAKWEAGPALYEVARKAASPARDERYASLADFRCAWDKARGRTQGEQA